MKKKTILSLSLGIAFILLLSGCGAGENLSSTSDNQAENYSGTLSIGDEIYEGWNNYYFDGIIENSVVISLNGERTMFVPIETTEWISLPYDNTLKVKVKKVNRENGTIEIELAKES